MERVILTDEVKPAAKSTPPPQFIPELKGKKVIIRLVSGGQPISGTIAAYNPYEILVQTAKGNTIVFKQAIVTIEPVSEPKK